MIVSRSVAEVIWHLAVHEQWPAARIARHLELSIHIVRRVLRDLGSDAGIMTGDQ